MTTSSITAPEPEVAPNPHGFIPQAMGPVDLWWNLFCARISQLKKGIKRNLRGTIQWEVQSPTHAPIYFYLKVDGDRTTGCSGVVADPDAWIETTEESVKAMLAHHAAPGSFKATGDVGFVQAVLEYVAGKPAAGNPLSIRMTR